jgi:segregation and condensation protein B
LSGRILTLNSTAGPDEAQVASAIESVLLVAPEPVSIAALIAATQMPRGTVERALRVLGERLSHGTRLQRHGSHVQLVTAPENVEVVQRFLGSEKPAPLSRAALETLTVVAYRQPVTRAEIEEARGVDSDHSIRKLLARGLIEERGHREGVGRAVEFGTTMAFLEYFGLTSFDELPPLPDDDGEALDPSGLGLRP